MTPRRRITLDEDTAQRVERLAAQWRVSPTDVVRRSVELAEQAAEPDPAAVLEQLFARGRGLATEPAEAWIRTVYEDRKRWRDE